MSCLSCRCEPKCFSWCYAVEVEKLVQLRCGRSRQEGGLQRAEAGVGRWRGCSCRGGEAVLLLCSRVQRVGVFVGAAWMVPRDRAGHLPSCTLDEPGDWVFGSWDSTCFVMCSCDVK